MVRPNAIVGQGYQVNPYEDMLEGLIAVWSGGGSLYTYLANGLARLGVDRSTANQLAEQGARNAGHMIDRGVTAVSEYGRHTATELGRFARDNVAEHVPGLRGSYVDNPSAISESAMSGVSPEKKRAKRDNDGQLTDMSATEVGGADATQNDSPVLNVPVTRPFPDTQTILMNHTSQMSFQKLRLIAETDNMLTVYMNSYVTPFDANGAVVTPVAGQAPAQGRTLYHSNTYITQTASGANSTTMFRDQLAGMPDGLVVATAKPSWATMMDLMYSAYTVLETNWKATIRFNRTVHQSTDGTVANKNPAYHVELPRSEMKAFAHYVSQGDSIAPLVLPISQISISEYDRAVGVVDKATLKIGETKSLTGKWYPGLVNHHPLNDGDIDRWTATGARPSAGHIELLKLHFKCSDDDQTGEGTYFDCEVKFECQWKVQFRALKGCGYWPIAASAELDVVATYPDGHWQLGPTSGNQ